MRRLFYLSLGVAAGAYASYRLQRAARAWTPAGLADSAAGVSASMCALAAEIRASSAAREAEIRDALGLDEADRERDEQVKESY